jgi:dihydroorotate dehydrogenase
LVVFVVSLPVDLYPLVRPLLFSLNAEKAHDLAFWIGERVAEWPKWEESKCDPKLRTQLAGLDLPSPLGLAAGLDKGARMLPLWKAMGFGFVEIGTVTPRPQPGNPKPRLFRVVDEELILNRMGFNSEGAEVVAQRLKHRPSGLIVGGNLGKNKVTPEEQALDDYRDAYRLIAPEVDYTVVNVSSPNTPGLRNLQAPEALKPLLEGLLHLRKEMGLERQPLFLKIAPDLHEADLDAVAEVSMQSGIDGLIATNTTLDRGIVTEANRARVEAWGAGGLSGRALRPKSRAVQQRLLATLAGRLPLVACGGISSGKDAREALQDGATALQIYTALIFQGPALVRRIHEELSSQ